MAAHPEPSLVIQRALHQARNLLRAPVEEPLRHRMIRVEHVQLHLLLVGEDFERAHKPRPARIVQHSGQRVDRLVDLRRRDGTLFHLAQAVRTGLAVPDVPSVNVKLRAVAITPRLGGGPRDRLRRLHLPQPSQLVRQDRALGAKLVLVRRVLVMAAAAAAKHRARRGHAFRRRLQHFERLRPHQPGLLTPCLDANALARQHERRQHDTPFHASQAVAAVDQLFHGRFEIAYDRIYFHSLP